MTTSATLTSKLQKVSWSDRRVVLALLLVIVGAVMSLMSPYFLRIDNLLSMTQFGAVVGLLALGQAMVILGGAGGIDLSVGSTMSLSGVLMGLVAQNTGVSPWIAALVALAAGLVLGVVNGFLVTVIRIPALIATLGTLFLYSSVALVLTGGGQTGGMDRDGFRFLGNSTVLGIPTQVLLVVVPCYLIVGAIFAWTRYGRRIYQVGNNELAAALVGTNVTLLRFSLYCWSGVLAAIAAIVSNSWLLTARPSAGLNLELQAVTIAVLGGIHIFGGRGNLGGVALAVLLVVVLNSGLQLAGFSQTVQAGVLGALLVISALLSGVTGFRPWRKGARARPGHAE
ncbi:ABC transporter permease [Agromyces aerolatus]|uniref:ABC transporter permease n=1 Tax=Agromyces sp. LY-1074 TaxID=3074080 RepID=UPI00285A6615|nr:MULTISPECIES: ABC transporter permease [unclassified Agromyces]MDR5700879.1 ABC transporter permease [Agromyces sp. LY-1074]MDR5707460.1 ABC transporter permease [Agromyces sp. LY-1358]